MRIAWIDDDIDIIDPVILPLDRDGHEIIRIRSVGSALELAQTLKACDLILLDMIIPPGSAHGDLGDYSGIELLRRLREEHKVKVPVIVFSVVNQNKVMDQLKPLGIEDYVRKPALPSELKAAADAVLARKADQAPDSDPTPESA